MVLVMCFTLLPAKKIVTMANVWWSGEGTEQNPYQIKTAEDLKVLADHVNAGYACENEYFKLMNDINLRGDFLDPIGGIKYYGFTQKGGPFNGIFDGNWYTISNFRIFEGSNNDAGLFGWIGADGIVKNLTIANSEIVGGFNVGSIAGLNYGKVSLCYNENTYVTGCNSGGIVGCNDCRGVVEYCSNRGIIYGTETSGGIVGFNNFFSLVIYCYNYTYSILGDENCKIGDIIGKDLGYYESWD